MLVDKPTHRIARYQLLFNVERLTYTHAVERKTLQTLIYTHGTTIISALARSNLYPRLPKMLQSNRTVK